GEHAAVSERDVEVQKTGEPLHALLLILVAELEGDGCEVDCAGDHGGQPQRVGIEAGLDGHVVDGEVVVGQRQAYGLVTEVTLLLHAANLALEVGRRLDLLRVHDKVRRNAVDVRAEHDRIAALGASNHGRDGAAEDELQRTGNQSLGDG